jgi:hypothetical protein
VLVLAFSSSPNENRDAESTGKWEGRGLFQCNEDSFSDSRLQRPDSGNWLKDNTDKTLRACAYLGQLYETELLMVRSFSFIYEHIRTVDVFMSWSRSLLFKLLNKSKNET